jgi:hypothetical protein
MVDVSVHAIEIEIRDADTRHLVDRPRPDAWLLYAVQDRRTIPAGAIRAQHPSRNRPYRHGPIHPRRII